MGKTQNIEKIKLIKKRFATVDSPEINGKNADQAKRESAIRRAYFDLNSPAAYSGVENVFKEAKNNFSKIKKRNVSEYLLNEKTYTLHKPGRKRYKRLKTIPSGLNSDWQCDLAIFDSVKMENDGYRYLLVCIDVLSRKIFVAPAKSKASDDMIQAFEKIWKKSRVFPHKLYSDQGLEFQAKKMLDYFLKKQIIKHVMYSPDLHAGVVERANRTIKDRLYRYFTQNKTVRWLDIVDNIVNAINNSVNRTIGITPNQVNAENAQSIFEKIYKPSTDGNSFPKFKRGDIVRINKEKGKFSKGYLPNYTEELFKIFQVKNTEPPHYKIVDLEGDKILGVFYEPELSLTSLKPNSQISQVIKERKNYKGEVEYFVHWIGEPTENDEWINIDTSNQYQLFKG
jgi:hypothetical protein